MGRPKADLVLSEAEQAQLGSMARSRSIPAALVTRARIVLAAAAGEPNSEIATRMQITGATAGKWRRRFIERRINGLYDELRPGKPRTIDDERVAELINTTLHTKPADGSTHWSVRAIAAETSISPTSVHRYFKLLGLQPHRSETFKLSTDAFFIEKLRDVVGLYLNPPDNALVLCVDEKSQCQALERTPPMLPMGLGYVEGVTRDYVRHGTTTLFAALNVLNGAVLAECKPRHRHQEFLAFLGSIDKAVPAELDVHCVHLGQGAGQQDRSLRRSLRRSLQPKLQSLHLDRHRRFHPRQAQQTLRTNQWDGTLAGRVQLAESCRDFVEDRGNEARVLLPSVTWICTCAVVC
jgi:putative transposase